MTSLSCHLISLKHFNTGKLYFHHDPQEVYLAVEMLEICSPLYEYKMEWPIFKEKVNTMIVLQRETVG